MDVKFANWVRLVDALAVMSPSNCKDSSYARGMLVGTVSTMMAFGMDFKKAIEMASKNAPKIILPESVPQSWLDDFDMLPKYRHPTGKEEFWERSKGH